MADDDAVADDGPVFGNVAQGDFVALGDGFEQGRAVGDAGASGQPSVVGDDGDIVALAHADHAGNLDGRSGGMHEESPCNYLIIQLEVYTDNRSVSIGVDLCVEQIG